MEAIAGGLHFDAIPFTGVAPDPQKVAEEQEVYNLVLEAVNALSPKNRTATLLFYQEQLSLHEIAALLGVSVAAVKGRLHKSRLQLRAQLLPLYAESNPRGTTEPRRSNMIKVTIADVIAQQKGDREVHVVVLWDEATCRVLPIWVGRSEGEASIPRPMTYNFMAKLLEAAGAELKEVRIEALKDFTFYAVAKLRSAGKVREVDARPSDAIALALHMNIPIYVAQELLEQHAVDIPTQGKNQLGKGLDSLREKRKKQKSKHEEWLRTAQSRPEEVKEKAYQELIAFLLGSE